MLVVTVLRNKLTYVEHIEKGAKKAFKKVENNICKRWCLRLAVLPLYKKHLKSKSVDGFYVMVTLS